MTFSNLSSLLCVVMTGKRISGKRERHIPSIDSNFQITKNLNGMLFLCQIVAFAVKTVVMTLKSITR